MQALANKYARVAGVLSARFGGPYHAAKLHFAGHPVFDDGGSIITPGVATSIDCKAQIDVASESMRRDPAFTENDMRVLILRQGATPDTDTEIEMLAGPHSGRWMLSKVTADSAGLYFECTGRRK